MSMKAMKILLLALLLFAIGCSKKQKTTPIDKDLKKYFSFKKGSFWIYKNNLKNIIDSYAVLNNEYFTVTDTHDTKYDAEKDNITVYRMGVIYDSIFYTWSLSSNGVSCLLRVTDTLEGSISINYGIFQYPFKLGRSSVDNALTNNIYPSLTIAGRNYQNVAEIVHDEVKPYHDTFYVSTDAGIIKMSIDRPQFRMILELQRSSILY